MMQTSNSELSKSVCRLPIKEVALQIEAILKSMASEDHVVFTTLPFSCQNVTTCCISEESQKSNLHYLVC